MKIYSNQAHLDVIRKSVEADLPVLLVGETGVGKTTIVREIAKEQGKELVRINLNGQTGIEELVGKWLINNGKTVWSDGVMVTAMKKGVWIVFDEINAALPEVLFMLNSLLDDDRKINMAEKNGEIVKPKEGFRFFATMNPTDEYSGTKEMNKALMSRFGAVLNIEPLIEDIERDLLVEAHDLELDSAKKLAKISSLLRKEKKDEQIFFFCSTRDLIGVSHLMSKGIDMGMAIETGIVNKANADERDHIKKIIQTVFNMKTIKTETEEKIDKEKEKADNARAEQKSAEAQTKQAMDAHAAISTQMMQMSNTFNEYFKRTHTELSTSSTKKVKEIAKDIFGKDEEQKEGEEGEKKEGEKKEDKKKEEKGKGKGEKQEGERAGKEEDKGEGDSEEKGNPGNPEEVQDGVATLARGRGVSRSELKKIAKSLKN